MTVTYILDKCNISVLMTHKNVTVMVTCIMYAYHTCYSSGDMHADVWCTWMYNIKYYNK